MSANDNTSKIPVFLGREISIKDRLKLQGSKPGETPCRKEAELYSSPYLDDFDSQMFALDHPEATGEALEKLITAAKEEHLKYQALAVQRAKDLCASCPLLATCREWVLETEPVDGPVYGIVAGMDFKERKRIHKRNARAKRQAAASLEA